MNKTCEVHEVMQQEDETFPCLTRPASVFQPGPITETPEGKKSNEFNRRRTEKQIPPAGW